MKCILVGNKSLNFFFLSQTVWEQVPAIQFIHKEGDFRRSSKQNHIRIYWYSIVRKRMQRGVGHKTRKNAFYHLSYMRTKPNSSKFMLLFTLITTYGPSIRALFGFSIRLTHVHTRTSFHCVNCILYPYVYAFKL